MVIAPVTFLIVVIFLFLFLVSLGKALSILLIFSKNWLFGSLIFSTVLFSISLTSALTFGISFLLLAWVYFALLKFFLVSRSGSLVY